MEQREQQWREAYLRQSHDAMVGRLFKGLIHNMNGVVQAFAMQGELFGMMFDQADGLLAALLADLPPGPDRERAERLRDLLYRRSGGITLMEEKIHQGQEIMGRTLELVDFSPTAGVGPYTVNSVIRTELEFLNADSFFKHTLHKEFHLDPDLPQLSCNQVEVHQALFALLENGLDAVRDRQGAGLVITTGRQGRAVTVTVTDNGPGMTPEVRERLFEPFFSTKEGRDGLGLYLARHLLARCGAELTCEESRPGHTCFALLLPSEDEGDSDGSILW